jgi:glycosyltransferase involved in cell wall biosynthesis
MEGFGWFTYETVKRIVLAHPEHQFIFFFDRSFDNRFIFADNVKGVVLRPQARHPILFKIWFNYSVTKALKKYKADVFLSPDGYLSLKTKVPQIAVIHDLNFEHYPEDLPKSARNYLREYVPEFAKKADHIITVSNYSKEDIISTYGIDSSKITVAYNGGSEEFKPCTISEKEIVKNKYTAGSDYFVFVGSLHPRKNIIRLFKAFEGFKQNSGSITKLLIVGEKLWKDNGIEKAYESLSFKKDVIFTGHLPLNDLTMVVGTAKALVFPSYFEGFGIPLVEAMNAGCPIICGNRTALPEIAGDAALLVDPFSYESIQQGLEKIDDDKELRMQLIAKGTRRAKDFSWDKSADIIWEVIESKL